MPFLILLAEIVSEMSIAAALSDSVIATIPVGLGPRMLAYDPSRSWLYVPNVGDNTVSVIEGTTQLHTISDPSFNFPTGVAFNPANGYVYVTNHGPQTANASQCGNTVS